MTQYVAVLGSEEEFGEFADTGTFRNYTAEALCDRLVNRLALTTPRSNPVKVDVELFSLSIVKGKIKRNRVGTYSIYPSLERMTNEEYEIEMDAILADFPIEFHSYVRSESYDRGHSAGMEECINYARGFSNLLTSINSYRRVLHDEWSKNTH